MAEDPGYTNVYLVVSGDYSDYHVWCVFFYKEDAERYVDEYTANSSPNHSWDTPVVEERVMWYLPPIVESRASAIPGETEALTYDRNHKEVA